MAKKKSKKGAFILKPWCWYCERDFEDEKVLLQHQKAKHFKCKQCPRKLNTAGGLMVHCQQVHKVEPDKLENTLPGRDGYEVEIFGMEGIPQKDLQEYRMRKEREAGVSSDARRQAHLAMMNKRPRIYKGVLSEVDLKGLLDAHLRLMSGKKEGAQMGLVNGFPPVQPHMAGAPPPTLPFQLPFPPTLPPANGGPPTQSPFPPPQSFMPQQGGVPPFPPNGGVLPPFPPQGGIMPNFAPNLPIGGPVPGQVVQEEVKVEVLKPKDGVIWPDPDYSPAEKRAQQSKYRYNSPKPQPALPFPPPFPPNFSANAPYPPPQNFSPSNMPPYPPPQQQGMGIPPYAPPPSISPGNYSGPPPVSGQFGSNTPTFPPQTPNAYAPSPSTLPPSQQHQQLPDSGTPIPEPPVQTGAEGERNKMDVDDVPGLTSALGDEQGIAANTSVAGSGAGVNPRKRKAAADFID